MGVPKSSEEGQHSADPMRGAMESSWLGLCMLS